MSDFMLGQGLLLSVEKDRMPGHYHHQDGKPADTVQMSACDLTKGCRGGKACQPMKPGASGGYCVPVSRCEHGTVATSEGGLSCAQEGHHHTAQGVAPR